MGNVVWTASQRDAIMSRGKSIAVSAAAGSGKTAVLTRRIIEKICAPDGSGDLSRMLVVTFTKAAASELVSRISDALSDELAKNPGNRHLHSQSLLVSSAPISTIHSFCLDLIKTNFQKLSIPPDFQAADETEIELMMKQTADELISDYFDGEIADETENISDFAVFADTFGDAANSDKLSDVVLSVYRTLSSTVGFLEKIREFRDRCHAAIRDGFDGSIWETAIRRTLHRTLCHYEQIYKAALHYIREHEIFEKYEEAFESDHAAIEALLAAHARGASYRELAFLLEHYAPVKLPPLRGVAGDHEMVFYKSARTDFIHEVRNLSSEYYGFSDEAILQALSGTEEMLEKLYIFLRAFERRFSEEKKRRKIITFADMERYALALLSAPDGSPSELAMQLRQSYDEIYIDEYQDTNEIQDRIFTLISRENNRFTVGDIKQSIYSFRGAEPSIFTELLDSRVKYCEDCPDPAVKIYLSENFRSSEEILAFCNGLFEELMNTASSRYGEDDRLNCGSGLHTQIPEIVLLKKKGRGDEDDEEMETEAAYVARRVSELLSGGKKTDGTPIRPSDIAILLRSASTSASVYENELKRRGIPCRNAASVAFFENPEVLLAVSLLNVIDNPSRDIYLAATLKSPLYGVSLDELLYIRRKNPSGSLFEALRAFTSENGFAKGEKFLADYERYRAMALELPCDRLIWMIYLDTGIFSVISSDKERPVYEIEEARANLIQLYQYARGFERGGFKGLSSFITFLGDVIAAKSEMNVSQFAAPGDVVNIMTIHKSKGLEFPVCFVCEMGRSFHFPELREKTIVSTSLGIAPKLTGKEGLLRMDTPQRLVAISALRERSISEEIRVLYVALTRAKEQLILTASVDAQAIERDDFDIISSGGEYALKNRFFSDHTIFGARNFLELVLTSAAAHPERCRIVIPDGDFEIQKMESDEHLLKKTPEDMTYMAAKKLVAERLTFDYPFRRLAKIPSKLSVSKLYPGVLDDSGEDMTELPIPVSMPNFLREEPDEQITAAERGTAIHTFMQFFDFESVARLGIAGEIDRLIEKRFLFASDREKIDVGKLGRFFGSRLAAEMQASSRMYREKRFMIQYPAALFTEDADISIMADENLLVQGVIDCAFFNDADELILVDYKTDSFTSGEDRTYIERILRERHSRQLGYYKLACEKIFGCLPAHTFIYSFALNDTVEI